MRRGNKLTGPQGARCNNETGMDPDRWFVSYKLSNVRGIDAELLLEIQQRALRCTGGARVTRQDAATLIIPRIGASRAWKRCRGSLPGQHPLLWAVCFDSHRNFGARLRMRSCQDRMQRVIAV